MNTPRFLGFFSLSLLIAAAGCAAPAADEPVVSEEFELQACSSSPASREVLVDLQSLARMECRAMMGAFAILEWEGRQYMDYVSDFFPDCDEQLAAMREASWPHHGLRGVELTRCRPGATPGSQTIERDLVLENQWTFRSVTTETR